MNRATLRAVLTPRLGIMLPLGFASGLPLALTGGTLQAWLTEAGLDAQGFKTEYGDEDVEAPPAP